MGALARTTGDYVGVIRRVVRQNGTHRCGICRRPYGSMGDALSCLDQCFQDFLALPPVVTRRHGRRINLRCRICARDYDDMESAMRCAESCRAAVQKSFATERAVLSKLPGLEGPRRAIARRPMLVQVVPPPIPAKRRAPSADVAVEPGAPEPAAMNTAAPPMHVANEPQEAAVIATASAAPQAAVEDTPKKKPDKKWIRDGAEYVCTICQAHYYTRVETEQCFDQHP